MPANPPSDALDAEPERSEPTTEFEHAAPPRTVSRRVARPSADAAAVTGLAAPAVSVVKEPEAPTAVEGTPPETSPQREASEAELPVSPLEETVAATAAATEPAEAVEPAVLTGRIEVPVPSVVRARERAELAVQNPVVLRAESLTKSYGQVLAAADISFDVHAGSLTGVVGPNGAGKTTVLSMISGLNRPTSGRITVHDLDVWADGPAAKRVIGSLPDRLRLFDRLTGAQLLYYAGILHGLDRTTVSARATELAAAFGLESALGRPVSDYSAGMQKKIGLACSMIHAPDVLMLDEPYETIDPVSASNVTEILEKYVSGGGSVIMSSHSLDLIQRICDHVVVIVDGSIVAKGTVDEVRGGMSLEARFAHLTNAEGAGKGLEWLHGSSDSD